MYTVTCAPILSCCLLSLLCGAAELPPDVVPASDRVLGQTAVNEVTFSAEAHGTQFVLRVSGAQGAQSLALATVLSGTLKPELAAPVQVLAQNREGTQFVVSFAAENEDGDTRWIATWLRRDRPETGAPSGNANWTLCGEWTVERFDHNEKGERNERHAFEFIGENALRRVIVRNNVEGVQTTCAQGCCKVWQSKTMNTQELETFGVNAATGKAECTSIRRWYLTGPNDALFGIAAKVYGNVAKFVTLQALNPDLQKQETLTEGQRVLYESWPRN